MDKTDSMFLKSLAYEVTNKDRKSKPKTNLWWMYLGIIIIFTTLFIFSEKLTNNQATILGVAGATLFSISILLVTLNKEKRNEYYIAKNNARTLVAILEQAERSISASSYGIRRKINYPDNWLDMYSSFAPYLKYTYLDTLLKEIAAFDAINEALAGEKGKHLDKLLEARRNVLMYNWHGFNILDAVSNIRCFSVGQSENEHWSESERGVALVDYVLANHSERIHDLTYNYLLEANGRCEQSQVMRHIATILMGEPVIKDKFLMKGYILDYSIFQVHLKYKESNRYQLCWGGLFLLKSTAE